MTDPEGSMTAVRVDSTNWSTGKRIVVIGATGGAVGGMMFYTVVRRAGLGFKGSL